MSVGQRACFGRSCSHSLSSGSPTTQRRRRHPYHKRSCTWAREFRYFGGDFAAGVAFLVLPLSLVDDVATSEWSADRPRNGMLWLRKPATNYWFCVVLVLLVRADLLRPLGVLTSFRKDMVQGSQPEPAHKHNARLAEGLLGMRKSICGHWHRAHKLQSRWDETPWNRLGFLDLLKDCLDGASMSLNMKFDLGNFFLLLHPFHQSLLSFQSM